MATWELIGYSTESGRDVRHREYTTSKRRAEMFDRIPRIQFTDSGHGIVFHARQTTDRRREPVYRMDYVREQMALLQAAQPKAPRTRHHGQTCTETEALLTEIMRVMPANYSSADPLSFLGKVCEAMRRAGRLV